MWGMSFVFVSNKSEWLTDSTTHTNLKIVVGSCLGAYIYNKTPSCPLPRFARIYFCTPPPPSRIISHRYAPARETSRWKHFCFFVVLINFQLSVKHFSVLPCYFMKQEDSLEKRWILKLTLNFRGDPSDTASTFLKMASDFDAVITITDCQIW